MLKEISISVRNLVGLVLRYGNIDSTYLSTRRAQEGMWIHQQIQNKRKREAKLSGGDYDSEVSVHLEFEYKEFIFILEGRVDGIYAINNKVTIEEIKSTLKPVITDAMEMHLAQAKLYGYMYCMDKALDRVGIKIIYCNAETNDITEFESELGLEDGYNYFIGLIERYYVFAQTEALCQNERLSSSKALAFPYNSFRKGQRELAAAVYKTIVSNRILFAQAPTGTGKTISTLFPAIKALDNGKIFYLTAKTVTRRVAVEAMELMREHGLVIRSVTLTSKEKICFSAGKCNPLDCIYANGHFDRINDAIIDLITNETIICREQLELYAHKHTVCPFELSLDAIDFCDCVICDYNHVYDPKTQIKRLFGDSSGKRKDLIILIDEAHNLIERAREMFSADLSRDDFSLRGIFRGNDMRIYRLLGRIRKWFKNLEGITVANELPTGLISMLREFVPYADTWLAVNAMHPQNTDFLELYFRVLDFLRISDLFSKGHICIFKDDKGASVRLLCLDPSALLANIHAKMRASIFFSATLTPMSYFRDVLGGGVEDFGIRLPSPFPQKNLCLMVSELKIDYKNRQNSIPAVAESVHSLVTSKPVGNYMIFFSSYEYMSNVYNYFTEVFNETVLLQTPGMTEAEKEQFLTRFVPNPKSILVGFVVMGGIFSEGIDLVGERLSGVAVVGVGLPMITTERNILSDYYKSQLGDGFQYAYMYPGMNKVMQAAGRVIRTEYDRGAVLLIDSRFTDYSYRRLFPDEWSHFIKAGTTVRIREVLEEFWNENTADGGL